MKIITIQILHANFTKYLAILEDKGMARVWS